MVWSNGTYSILGLSLSLLFVIMVFYDNALSRLEVQGKKRKAKGCGNDPNTICYAYLDCTLS